MRSVLLIGICLAATAQGEELVEHGCALMVTEAASSEVYQIELDPNEFSLLSAGPDSGPLSIQLEEGLRAEGLICQRSSAIPAEHDSMALDAGLPLTLKDAKRTVVLEKVNGQYRLRILEGEFSDSESQRVQEALDAFQARSQSGAD